MEELTPEQQVIEQEALNKYNEVQQKNIEQATGETNELPDGFNPDGTPIDENEPEPILGKFKSQEDLVKAYQELEKKLGSKEAPAPDTTTEVVNDKGVTVDVSKYNQEYVETGDLSEDSYQQLEKLGFSKADVDRYIAGQNALVETYRNKIYGAAGGEENYVALVDWAAANLDRSIIVEYNDAVGSGNINKSIQLLEYMQLKAGTTVPKQPNRVTPISTSDSGGLKPFTDKGEWQKATANNLYGKDAKYTKMVDNRFLAAKRAGTI